MRARAWLRTVPIFEECRDEVLTGVLLHVVQPPSPVQRHPHRVARRQGACRLSGRGRCGGDEVDGGEAPLLACRAAEHVEHGEGGVTGRDGALVGILRVGIIRLLSPALRSFN